MRKVEKRKKKRKASKKLGCRNYASVRAVYRQPERLPESIVVHAMLSSHACQSIIQAIFIQLLTLIWFFATNYEVHEQHKNIDTFQGRILNNFIVDASG